MCSRRSVGQPSGGRSASFAPSVSRQFSGRPGWAPVSAQHLQPLFHLPHAGEEFVQLGPVRARDLAAEAGGVVLDRVQDAARALASPVLEQAVEGQRGVHLQRHGRAGALPGDVRAIGHRVVALVIAGVGLLAPEHQARLHGVLSQSLGQHLVHADAALEDRALLQRNAREQAAGHAGVNPHPGRGLVEQAADEVHLGLERLHRLQALAELHLRDRAPLAHQWLALMPLPMNSTANRLGCALAASAPRIGRDSSQGSATATPAPRNSKRRDG